MGWCVNHTSLMDEGNKKEDEVRSSRCGAGSIRLKADLTSGLRPGCYVVRSNLTSFSVLRLGGWLNSAQQQIQTSRQCRFMYNIRMYYTTSRFQRLHLREQMLRVNEKKVIDLKVESSPIYLHSSRVSSAKRPTRSHNGNENECCPKIPASALQHDPPLSNNMYRRITINKRVVVNRVNNSRLLSCGCYSA